MQAHSSSCASSTCIIVFKNGNVLSYSSPFSGLYFPRSFFRVFIHSTYTHVLAGHFPTGIPRRILGDEDGDGIGKRMRRERGEVSILHELFNLSLLLRRFLGLSLTAFCRSQQSYSGLAETCASLLSLSVNTLYYNSETHIKEVQKLLERTLNKLVNSVWF